MDCPDVQERLDAYLDRELPATESAAVRDHLAACEACGSTLAAREALGKLVRQAPYYSNPITHQLMHTARAQRQSRAALKTWLSLAAAGLILLLGATFLARRPTTPVPASLLADVIVDNHVRSLMGEHLFDVRSTDQHTVKPWFLGKLDFSPPVQDLASAGFPLIGGRLEYVAGHQAAALIYTRGQHTINVFIWPDSSSGGAPVDAQSIRGFHVRHWTKAGMTFWAVSDLNEAELDDFVRALQA